MSHTQYCVILHSNKRMYNFLYSIYNCIKTDKIRKKMTKQQTEKLTPRYGFINDIARTCGCSRHTVRAAIYDNATGKKAEKVRKYYKATYKDLTVK